MKKELAIIILNWRAEERTLKCIRTIREWNNGDFQVFIVNNEETIESQTILESQIIDEILLKSAKNEGFAGGNNIGIKAAITQDYPYILLLNTDAEINESTILTLLKDIKSDSNIFAIGPSILEGTIGKFKKYSGGRDIGKFPLTRLPSNNITSTSTSKSLIKVQYVPGMIFLCNAKIIKEIGLMDASYFFSGEIADWCKVASIKNYYSYINSTVEGIHYTDLTDKKLRNSLYLYYGLRNRFLYTKKFNYSISYRLYWFRIGLLQLLIATLKLEFIQARAFFLALWHGYTGQFGNKNEYFLK